MGSAISDIMTQTEKLAFIGSFVWFCIGKHVYR